MIIWPNHNFECKFATSSNSKYIGSTCTVISASHCATFINWCLYSNCEIVSFAARHGVYYSRMLSPIGRNSLFCCSRFNVSLSDIACINKSFLWARRRSLLTAPCLSTVSLLLELLFVKLGFFLFRVCLRTKLS